MSKNPVLPYAIIAIVGIFLVIIISYFGVNQREAILNPDEEGATTEAADVDDIYQSNCAACHGAELSGGSAPDLTEVNSSLSEDEIKDIIIEGTDGGMPGGLVDNEQAAELAEWLSEME
ncbi:MAG TPA: cytochrome c [Bacillota bacterium]|nr:cytochrome c [Bacillota bacterium]